MRGFEIVKDEYRKNEAVFLPERSTKCSAGYDFKTPVDIEIKSGEDSELIFTDVKAYMGEKEYLQTHIRSSLGIKKGVILANITGIIDSDYYSNDANDGNIAFKLKNLGKEDVFIPAGSKIMQGIFCEYLITDNDSAKETRIGGFGSTGNK